ncbi:hypothetical protein SDRG_00770 [Saprolegnia diclina VS20]|uniref:Calcineurin-like phosphoesterase domain-containing protein n=1 Tax=Saprolegnia diclina (strain VS20) TaxID=1156394 RepID=T0QUM9_SAPDV|nr:hypothetical protein SDRG_00770 [Saprolegnia diclina VS20]EQC41914.1 hypothetical protein SDRG_00770 [Saprolegnia diclina VS20]|eukprot:XP_008604483.1 hypothetical protein SDRG_00770 [Saprolegnia diclina VS20]
MECSERSGQGPPGSCCKLYASGGVDTSRSRYKVDYFSRQAGQATFSIACKRLASGVQPVGIKWVNVVGSHDIGGSDFICGERDNAYRECKDTAEML